jgi:signal transduction histidine kinase
VLFRGNEPAESKAGRLSMLLIAIFLLALLAFIRIYLEHGQLVSQLSDSLLKKTQLEQERRELSGRLIRAQEFERSRIGRELHDDLSQQVALLAFGLSQLSKRLPTHKLRVEVLRLLEETKRLSGDVHRLSHELHSSVLDHLGLVAAAQALCDEVSRQHKVTVHFTESDFTTDVSPEVSLCLFRILQETLNNISKHSHGTFARVTLMGTAEGVLLTAHDDGVGFDPTDKRNRCGLGLLSMSERMSLVGGTLEIHSVPSQGTTVRAWVPARPVEVPRDAVASEQSETFAKPGVAGANDGTSTGTLG